MDFIHYMFWPEGAPWYTGAFWSNQVQWTVVELPVILLGLWKLERNAVRRHRELRKHLGLDSEVDTE